MVSKKRKASNETDRAMMLVALEQTLRSHKRKLLLELELDLIYYTVARGPFITLIQVLLQCNQVGGALGA